MRWDEIMIHQSQGYVEKWSIENDWILNEHTVKHERWTDDKKFSCTIFQQCVISIHVYELPKKIIIEWNSFHSQSISQVCISEVRYNFSDFFFAIFFLIPLSQSLASLNSDINSLMLCTHNMKLEEKCVNNFVHRSLSLFRKQSCLCQSSIK